MSWNAKSDNNTAWSQAKTPTEKRFFIAGICIGIAIGISLSLITASLL